MENKTKEQQFIDELNALVEKYGLVIRGECSSTSLYDLEKMEWGSYVGFNSFINEYVIYSDDY